MKLNTQSLPNKLITVFNLFKKYSTFMFTLTGLIIFAVLVLQIRTLANREPSEEMVSEKSSQSKPMNIDESAVKKIQQLQSANVEVKALFEKSRDNPFQE